MLEGALDGVLEHPLVPGTVLVILTPLEVDRVLDVVFDQGLQCVLQHHLHVLVKEALVLALAAQLLEDTRVLGKATRLLCLKQSDYT